MATSAGVRSACRIPNEKLKAPVATVPTSTKNELRYPLCLHLPPGLKWYYMGNFPSLHGSCYIMQSSRFHFPSGSFIPIDKQQDQRPAPCPRMYSTGCPIQSVLYRVYNSANVLTATLFPQEGYLRPLTRLSRTMNIN